MKNIESLDNSNQIKHSDCDVRRAMIGDTLILEEYINKKDGEVKMYYLLDEDTKEIMDFVDVETLKNSEDIFNRIKAHYINKKINLSDKEIEAIANKRVEEIADIIMDSGKSRMTN